MTQTTPIIQGIMPFFIVEDLAASTACYRDHFGFRVTTLDPEEDPFFAIVVRDGASLMLKAIGLDVPPQPNATRHPWARWDAFLPTPDPDVLHDEFLGRGADILAPVADTEDGLRAFEVRDNSGYVLCFGRPL